MARKVVQKTSFLGGEAGPLLEGRSDLAQFQLGAEPGQNFIFLKGGGATRRPGTRYVRNTASNKPARLIPFIISYDASTDIHIVELALTGSTTITVNIYSTAGGAGVSPTPSTFTVTSGIDLNEIQYAQSASNLFLVSKHFSPKVITRTSTAPAFTISDYIAFSTTSRGEEHSLPYRTANTSATTLAVSATTGTGVTLTASTGIFTDSSVVGNYYRITSGGPEGYVKVTAWTSTTEVTVTVVEAVNSTSATTNWAEGSWSTFRGWPRTITFYNQRLVFGGNTSEPDTFWMSQVDDYFQMSATTSGIDDPLSFTLASNKLNQIRWMVGGKKLTIGTSSSEWVGTVTNDGTNLYVDFDEETSHGSAAVQPSKSAYTIPFVQRAGQTVREMAFDFDSDSYQATDLNLFGSHVGSPYGRYVNSTDIRIVQMAYQESPFGVLWAIDSVGRLYGLTRDKQQQIASWHSHVIGGVLTETIVTGLSGEDHPAWVTSICIVPDSNGRRDRLWMVVRRAINGVEKYFVEYMDDIKVHSDITSSSATNVKTFLDCASLSTGSAATTWTGFNQFASHLGTYVVAFNAYGVVVHCGAVSVNSSGEFTLSQQATTVVVGLHSNAYLRLLPIEGGQAPEINFNSEKGVDSAAIRLYQTWGLRIGKNRILRQQGNESNTTFEPIPFDNTQIPVETFTGTKIVPVPCDEGTDVSFALAMQEPWPCTVLSISSRVTSNEV